MNYVYQLTEIETGKIYIGSRYSKDANPEELGVSYFTSSNHVAPGFKSNPNAFRKHILFIGKDARLIENDILMSVPKEDRTKYLNRRFHKDGFSLESCLKGLNTINKSGLGIKGAKASVRTHGPQMANGGKKGGRLTAERGIGMHTFECRSKAGKTASSHKYKCNGCDLISNKGPLTQHQRSTGHNGMVSLLLKES